MMVINLFGGPGVGKSTMAAELFVKMKKYGYKVELVTEFAKDLVYASDSTRLDDQLMVFSEQHHRLFRLKDEVDYVITDSPLLITKAYNKTLDPKTFEPFVNSVFDSYNNINFLIERNDSFYQKYGREQDLSEAKEIDNIIEDILKYRNYYDVRSSEDIVEYMKLYLKGSFEDIINRSSTTCSNVQVDE